MADPTIEDKILDSVKQMFGYEPDYDPFDIDMLIHINSIVATLTQLGVGPDDGLTVDKDTLWSSLLANDATLNGARSYVFMRLKMLFDASSMPQHLIAAYEKMILQAEERLKMAADPYIPQEEKLELTAPILDGGGP